MTKAINWKNVVKAVITVADSNLAKELDKKTATYPEDVDQFVSELVHAAKLAAGERVFDN